MKYLVLLALVGAAFAAPQQRQEDVQLVRSNSDFKEDGSFSWDFETSDGTKVEQSGYIKNPNEPDPEQRIQVLQGSFNFVDQGVPFRVTYVADENGFQPEGDHLPVAPPTPDHVLKTLAIINANAANQRAARSNGRQ